MEELRIPQREVEARILLTDGRRLDGVVRLPTVGPDGEPFHLAERLNHDKEGRFVPLLTGDRVHLVSRDHILTVLLMDSEEQGDNLEETFGRQLLIRLYLSSGEAFDGELAILRDQESERLQDFLNNAPRFLSLRLPNGRRMLASRRQITSALTLHEGD